MTQKAEQEANHTGPAVAGNSACPAAQIADFMCARFEVARRSEPKGKVAILEAAHHDALALSRHFEAIVFASRIEAGIERLKPQSLQVDSLLKDLIPQLQPFARVRGVELTVQPSPPASVMADHAGLKRLVLSMIDAALLGGHMGTRLTVRVSAEEDQVRIEAEQTAGPGSDHGPESPADGPGDPILEPEAVRSYLDLLDPILTAHSGGWHAEWTPSGDLAIALTLPAIRAAQGPSGQHVLIVDDDPDGAFLLEQVLLKGDYKVRIAANGLEGLAQARSGDISLILLDVMLPGMDGFEVCHRLKEDPATNSIPIVMISAKSRPEDRAMGLRVGATEYMTKPLSMNEVIQTVNALARPIEGETKNG